MGPAPRARSTSRASCGPTPITWGSTAALLLDEFNAATSARAITTPTRRLTRVSAIGGRARERDRSVLLTPRAVDRLHCRDRRGAHVIGDPIDKRPGGGTITGVTRRSSVTATWLAARATSIRVPTSSIDDRSTTSTTSTRRTTTHQPCRRSRRPVSSCRPALRLDLRRDQAGKPLIAGQQLRRRADDPGPRAATLLVTLGNAVTITANGQAYTPSAASSSRSGCASPRRRSQPLATGCQPPASERRRGLHRTRSRPSRNPRHRHRGPDRDHQRPQRPLAVRAAARPRRRRGDDRDRRRSPDDLRHGARAHGGARASR